MIFFLFSMLLLLETSAKSVDDIPKMVYSFFEHRCFKNGNNNSFSELQQAEYDFDLCISTIHSPNENTSIAETFCKLNFPIQHDCLKNYLDKLAPCLEQEEKYLYKFVLDGFDSVIAEFCKDNGSFLLEQLRQIQEADYCMTKIKSDRFGVEALGECVLVLDIVEKLNEPYFVVTNDTLCRDLRNFQDCLLHFFYKECQSNVLYTPVITIFSQLLNWCV